MNSKSKIGSVIASLILLAAIATVVFMVTKKQKVQEEDEDKVDLVYLHANVFYTLKSSNDATYNKSVIIKKLDETGSSIKSGDKINIYKDQSLLTMNRGKDKVNAVFESGSPSCLPNCASITINSVDGHIEIKRGMEVTLRARNGSYLLAKNNKLQTVENCDDCSFVFN